MMWGKYGTARQATDKNIIRQTRFIYWTTKATDIHIEYIILIAYSMAKMVTRTRLTVTLYVHCMSCYKSWEQFTFGAENAKPFIVNALASPCLRLKALKGTAVDSQEIFDPGSDFLSSRQ